MKKYILILFTLLGLCLFVDMSFASVSIPGSSELERVSADIATSGNVTQDIARVGFDILRIVKRILMGLMVIFLVYTGAMMIMSMGSNEEQLSSAKRQLWYMLVALVFINIPGTLYEAFYKDSSTTVGNTVTPGSFGDATTDSSGNLFFDVFVFGHALNDQIVMFLEVMIFMAAIAMITISGIQVIVSRGKEETLSKAKSRILYTVLALIFVGIIEAWKRFAFGGVIADGANIFESLANLALFFAVPVAVLFIAIAGYYYITSNGDEERVKKAKSIIVNTVLATLILIASYTFLLELA